MSVPRVINDNGISDITWNALSPSKPEYEFPFSDKGDHVTFKAKLTYRQDQLAYGPRTPMTRVRFTLGDAYLTKLGEPRDIGCGLFEYTDTFCSVPVRRQEYGSFPFLNQWVFSGGTEDPRVEEQTITTASVIDYEYFPFIAPLPLYKLRAFILGGRVAYFGGIPPLAGFLVAEDSNVSIYEGRIFERRTVYVPRRLATIVT